jgi:outer membrane cobalamin receptor
MAVRVGHERHCNRSDTRFWRRRRSQQRPSAIYGSDAVAGVVNFITRQNFTGAETSLRYGLGDAYHDEDFSQLFGKAWSTGSVTLAYEYCDNTGPSDLLWARRRNSVFATTRQELSDNISVWSDASYSDRHTDGTLSFTCRGRVQ